MIHSIKSDAGLKETKSSSSFILHDIKIPHHANEKKNVPKLYRGLAAKSVNSRQNHPLQRSTLTEGLGRGQELEKIMFVLGGLLFHPCQEDIVSCCPKRVTYETPYLFFFTSK
ncbi:hypothetical protein CDAR_78961 [Caerostris darwini]|uniref:Uncharacterized protein n=1 Tax=Caerostris darwini TaxID=1538125 RepID=A0AAV4Q6W0_9ARAC|nr:hypothetical protein CDAR_78961 [Caerostris darwini]